MSLEDDLKKVGSEYRPRAGWQTRVLHESTRPRAPVAWMVTAGAFAMVAAVFAFFFVVQHQHQVRSDLAAREAHARLQKEKEELQAKIEKIILEQKTISDEKDQLISELQFAKTPNDQDQISKKIRDNQDRARAATEELHNLQQQQKRNITKVPGTNACKNPNDPLCGI